MKLCPLCVIAAAMMGGSMIAMAASPEPKTGMADKAHAAGAPSKAEQDKMMEAMAKAATPGSEHEMLKVFVGEWKSEMTMMMEGQPPMTMEGKSTYTLELGGRVLKQTYTGKSEMGEFQGQGSTGYDNVSKRWWGNWMDNWSTSCMTTYGTYDAKTRTWESKSEPAECPMGQGMMTMRTVLTMKSDDAFTFSMYSTIEGKKETKSGEIKYTRVKK